MQGRRSALAAGVVVALLAGAPMVAFAQPRAVVELFTSQGCSSCPAADKLLSDFTADGSIVALSLPIDYWDYLGWRDTLARPRHTARQRNYSAVRGDRQVYTPQVVVNGSAQALGSDRSAIEAAITNTQHGKRLPVMVAVTPNGSGLDVAVSENAAAPAGEVWLCGIAKAIKVAIGRGENRGHTFTYHNVVRRWIKLGEWHGTSKTWNVPRSDVEGDQIDAVAVLVQGSAAKGPGPMLGATIAPLQKVALSGQ
ncbi:MAG: DUF1223 domain-containing protein [Rhizobiales bacterium]|nr:DUF1223 domain-containing protein [Hyphomicrobiales bacterium]